MFYSYLPAIGRFLIVVTFIEDALRIITQWNDQLVYLKDFRHSTCPIPYVSDLTPPPSVAVSLS
jgi:ER-derived vesicles protein